MLKHLETELVPYLEGKLSEDDTRRVEEHLRECPTCRDELEETRRFIQALAADKTLFCPSSSLIFDYATKGEDPNGVIAQHLEECESCRVEYAQYCQAVGKQVMPNELWAGIKARLAVEGDSTPSAPREIRIEESFAERFSRWFRLPAVITALVAAAVLVLFVHQSNVPHNMVGLTSVAWENLPQPKDGGQRQKTALVYVIRFEGFKERIPQPTIDSLYRSLVPDIDVLDRYSVPQPAEVTHVIENAGAATWSRTDLYRLLAEKWRDGLAVVVTISPSAAGVAVDARLQDLRTDREVKAVSVKHAPRDHLEKTIQGLVRHLVMTES
ncbi:MAG: zf-HC2 domain-containing protein [Desulfomonilaceae bacterium]